MVQTYGTRQEERASSVTPTTEGAPEGPVGAPLAKMAEAQQRTTPSLEDSELYTLDENTETVQGRVNEYSKSSNPVLQREAQKGRDEASRRGLTNSTIAGGNAIGKVLDKTTEWATADAQFANNRKTENLRALTSKYGTDESVKASKYSSDNQLLGTKISSAAQVQSAGISANATMGAARIQASSAERVQEQRGKIDALNIVARANTAKLDRQSQEKVAIIGERSSTNRANTAHKRNAQTANQDTFTRGVAQIDQTASAATQQQQFDRLDTRYKANEKAIATW
jgi:hypothetical protein